MVNIIYYYRPNVPPPPAPTDFFRRELMRERDIKGGGRLFISYTCAQNIIYLGNVIRRYSKLRSTREEYQKSLGRKGCWIRGLTAVVWTAEVYIISRFVREVGTRGTLALTKTSETLKIIRYPFILLRNARYFIW